MAGTKNGSSFFLCSEGLWLSASADFVTPKNMLFNVDIRLSDGTYGLRSEDGIMTTNTGVRELAGNRREAICLQDRGKQWGI